jgi:hypothetical protein
MGKYALVVMSEPGEANPGGQGRMIHAMSAVRDLKAAGHEVKLWLEGVGVTWLSAFDGRTDPFTQHYGQLFDTLRGDVAACEFCTSKRFGASASASRLGATLEGGSQDHHSVASLLAGGYQVLTF